MICKLTLCRACLISTFAVRVSSFRGARVATPAMQKTNELRMGYELSEGIEFDANPIVVVLALVGWIAPSSIPTNIPLTHGTGLSQAFFESMNQNLANFPKGPAADDPFWTLLVLWHIGMFACLIFGTIGYNLNRNPSTD